MPRKAAMVGKPTSQGQYASKVYWSNGDEELQVRIIARSQGKTISRYIRDLVMEDLAIRRRAQPQTPIISTLPPGFQPGDEITFYKPDEIASDPLSEAAADEARFRKLLEEE